MGRKNYLDDLAKAQALRFGNISKIVSREDGELTFTLQASGLNTTKITAMISDVSQYPKFHSYMLFASDEAPSPIAKAVQKAPNLRRKTVPQLLEILSKHFANISTNNAHSSHAPELRKSDAEMPDSSDFDDGGFDTDDDGTNEDWAMEDDFYAGGPSSMRPSKRSFSNKSHESVSERIRSDFLAVKGAGFRVGALGHLQAGNSCYVTVSCRIEKLGISEEAMQAWCLDPSHYLCLLIYFPTGYRSFQELTSMDTTSARQHVQFRVGECDTYKPSTPTEAQNFFNPPHSSKNGHSARGHTRLKETFISRPINALLNERLIGLTKLRMSEDISWWGAEDYYTELLGKQSQHSKKAQSPKKIHRKADPVRKVYPPLVWEDELVSPKKTSQLSFPLVSMQFLLRHFVRCTEFCLVCHTRIDSEVDAIKPYVCNKPLCLFQYLNLGAGPSIEHEILAQPFVVDLLVSFCWASVKMFKLRTYPTGLGWIVPHPESPIHGTQDDVSQLVSPWNPLQQYLQQQEPTSWETKSSKVPPPRAYKARLNRQARQLLLDKGQSCPLKRGDWIAINIVVPEPYAWHVCITEVMFPTVSLSRSSLVCPNSERIAYAMRTADDKWLAVDFYIYQVKFDDLHDRDKAKAMLNLMRSMPNVHEMADYLAREPNASLSRWQSRMTPASVGLLRWIIASNRSCIIQTDVEVPQTEKPDELRLGVKKGEQRIPRIDGWLQFRFAMGAPDKEQRFINSLQHGNPTYPTLFAWHGSPLHNWHGIVREGLNFNEVQHGRAMGNGCYHATAWGASIVYSQGLMGLPGQARIPNSTRQWPSSILQVDSAIVLNEIVNAPEKYTRSGWCYVVQHVDWIQTRYLFVQPLAKVKTAPDIAMTPQNTLHQDPQRIPDGPQGQLSLPLNAVPRTRRRGGHNQQQSPASASSKGKSNSTAVTTDNLAKLARGDKGKGKGTRQDPIDLDTASVSTSAEDRELLRGPRGGGLPPTPRARVPQTPVTDYKPHSVRNLPMLPPPQYATTKATKSLQKAFLDLLKVQEAHIKQRKLSELGWYMDEKHLETTNNIYQWMIQMHSFPLDLPLGQDMKAAGIDAIVLEIRFSANYPFSPPFIRVVQPRFLAFAMGGGGHVTAGGSICTSLLTNSGWTAVATMESVLLQIRMDLMSTDPRPARLQCMSHVGMMGLPFPGTAGYAVGGVHGGGGGGGGGEYNVFEAVDAYVRACRTHGWQVPPELRTVTGDAMPSGYGFR